MNAKTCLSIGWVLVAAWAMASSAGCVSNGAFVAHHHGGHHHGADCVMPDWICYGYHPTCWRPWPPECPNCPPYTLLEPGAEILKEPVAPIIPAPAGEASPLPSPPLPGP
jgi:hypothetical protein